MADAERENGQSGFHPPYASFKSLTNLLDQMAEQGVPDRIDRSYLHNKSGSIQSQLLTTLRALGLIKDNNEPEPRLREMAEDADARARILRELLHECYEEPLARPNGTRQQLEEWVRRHGVSGSTVDKCIAFFVQAADAAEVPISPHYKAAGTSRKRRTGQRKSRPPVETGVSTQTGGVSDATPETATLEQLRVRYIDMLLERAEQEDELNTELLDRLEGLLGLRDTHPGDATRSRQPHEE